MKIVSPRPFDPSHLRLGADLRRLSIEPVRSEWHCVRRGVWVPQAIWDELDSLQRQQAFIHATVLQCREPDNVVVSAHSAAAMWGLPRIEMWPRHVSVLDLEGTMAASRYIHPRHASAVEPVLVRGIAVTPVARTIIELTATDTLDTALAAADYALAAGLVTREELDAEATLLEPGARGRGMAGLLIDLADGRSESPAESLSRLQMYRANLPRPRLQQEYWDEAGQIGRTDFDWDRLIGECDGKKKYKVPEGASPDEATEIVWREKQREDRLRRNKPVARWVYATAKSTAALATLLIGHGLQPLPRNTWFDLGGSRRGVRTNRASKAS